MKRFNISTNFQITCSIVIGDSERFAAAFAINLVLSRRNRILECSMMMTMMDFVVGHHERRSTSKAIVQSKQTTLFLRWTSIRCSKGYSLQLVERNKRIQLQNMHSGIQVSRQLDRLILFMNGGPTDRQND